MSSTNAKKILLISVLIIIFLGISAVHAENFTDVSNNDSEIVKDTSQSVKTDSVKSITLKPEKLSTTYGSGKYFKVKAVDSKTKKTVPNVKLTLKVFTGKKYKKTIITTDSNGIAKYPASFLKIGKHKVVMNVKDTRKFASKAKTSFIKVSKAKLTVKAPKVVNIFKSNQKFKVTILNKESKKAMKGIRVFLKVFTGSKFKKYILKTNKNGVVSINTKKLSKSTHKIVVNVKKSSKVKAASAKSSVKIKDSSKHIKLKVNGHALDVKLENNKAAKALLEKLKKGDITINAKEYGGFEKVGGLGFSLPADDKYITTKAGDIVLYDGDEVSLFYNSNSWDYTRLGKVQNVNSNDLKQILGSGNVKLTFTLH